MLAIRQRLFTSLLRPAASRVVPASALSLSSLAGAKTTLSASFARNAFSTSALARFTFSPLVRYENENGNEQQGGEAVIFLGNLPFSLGEEDIREICSKYGVGYIRLATSATGRPMGYAHLTFPSHDLASNFLSAIESREVSFGERSVRADFAMEKRSSPGGERRERDRTPKTPTQTLFVGNLLYTTDEASLRSTFEQYGSVERVSIGRDPSGGTRGFAHVMFSDVPSASAAVEASEGREGIYVLGRRVRTDYAAESRGGARDGGRDGGRRVERVNEPYHKLYFREFYGDEMALRDSLGEMERKVASIYFLKDKETQSPIGSGFIDFFSPDVAGEALEKVQGLKLNYARPPKERSPREERGSREDRGSRGSRFDY